jgi:hypothetical protein
MSAGWIQLAAKGVQDEMFTQKPEISFFRAMFTKKSDFTFITKETPFINSVFQFGSTQVCQLKKFGDVIKNITLKLTLPSTYITGTGYSYPTLARDFVPTFMYLDSKYNILSINRPRPSVVYYNTNDPSWLPSGVRIQSNFFTFTTNSNVPFIGFRDTTHAGFWGFKNFIAFVNGIYVYPFTGQSEKSIIYSGWVNSYYPYFRPYSTNAGMRSIKNIDLYIGGQLIESVPGEYIMIYNDVSVPQENQKSLPPSENIGVAKKDYYILIPFSVTRVGLPVCALYSHDIDIHVTFEPIDSLLSNLTSEQYTTDATFPVAPTFSGYNGSEKVFLIGNTIGNTPINELVGNVSTAVFGSNVYMASGTNVFTFNLTTKTYSYFDTTIQSLSQCVGTGSTFKGVIQYTGTSFQNITENYDISFETVRAPIKTLGTKTYLPCSNGFLIHDTINLTSITPVQCNTASSFTELNSDVWFVNSNVISVYRNSTVSNLYTVPNVSLIESYTSNIYAFENSNVTLLTQATPITFTVPYPVTSTTSTSNGLYIGTTSGLYMASSPTTLNGPFLTQPIHTCYKSNGYVYFSYEQTTTIQSVIQFTDSPTFPPPTWRENTLNSISNVFLSSDFNSNIFVCQNNTLWKFTDDDAFSGGQVTISPLNDTNEKTVYHDGTALYVYPRFQGSTIYKYDGTTLFYNTNYTVDTGTINMYNSKVTTFPSTSSTIFQYNTTGSFKSDSSFTKVQLQTPSSFNSSVSTSTGVFVSSNTNLMSFTQADTPSPPILCGTGGQSDDGYVFSNQRVARINTLTNTLDTISTFSDSFTLGSVSQIDSSRYLVSTADTMNVYSVSVLSGQVLKVDLGYPVPNHSNTSVTVGTNIYIFPDQNESNIYVFNSSTSQTSRLPTPPLYVTSLTYDGRYINAFNGTSTAYRLDTTLDTFTNPDAYSYLTVPTQVYTSKTTRENSNVFMFSSPNINVFRGATQTFDTYPNPLNTVPVSTKRFGANTFVIATNSNVTLYSTQYNTLSNTMTLYKQPLSLEYNGQSNVYISYTDGTIGSFDYSSNDYTGTGYFVSDSLSLTQPITRVTSNVILTTNTLTTLPDKTTVALPSTNTFSIVTNSYVFPSLGSEYITRTPTLSAVRFTNFEESISDAVETTSDVYFCSRITGNVYTSQRVYDSGLNGFIGVQAYSSNIYFISQSTILSYFTPMRNFTNVYSGTTTNFFVPHTYSSLDNTMTVGNYMILKSTSAVLNFSQFPEYVENTYPSYTFLDPSSNSIGATDGSLVLVLDGTTIKQYELPVTGTIFTKFSSDDSTFIFWNSQYVRWASTSGSANPFQVDFGNSTILSVTVTPSSWNVIMYKNSDPTQVNLHRFIGNSVTPTITQLTSLFNNPYLIITNGQTMHGFQNNGGTNVFSITTTGYVTGTSSILATLRGTQGLVYNNNVYLSSGVSSALVRVQQPVTDPSSYQTIDFATPIHTMTRIGQSNIAYMSNTSNIILQYNTTAPFTLTSSWSTSRFAQPQSNVYGGISKGNTLTVLSANTIQYFNTTKPATFSLYQYPFVSNVFDMSGQTLSLYSGSSSPTTTLFNTSTRTFSSTPGLAYVTTCIKGTGRVFSGPTSAIYDGRYTITSDGVQYDTLYTSTLQRNLGSYVGVSSYGSNVFLVNQDSFVTYDASRRSYTEISMPGPCYELTWANGSIFAQSGPKIYKDTTEWVTLPSSVQATDSALIGTNIIFTTQGLISNVNTITPFGSFLFVDPKFGSRVVADSSQYYLPSSTDLTLWRSGPNFTTPITGVFGSTWILGSNVYGITQANTLYIYDSSYFALSQVTVPDTTSYAVVHNGQLVYITNSFPFGNPVLALSVASSTVNALCSDGVYYTYNLNTQSITNSIFIGAVGKSLYPFGTSVFVTSLTNTIRYPLSSTQVNQYDFSELGIIRGITFDGRFIYTLSNPIYIVDTRAQVLRFVRLDRNQPQFSPTTGFFDGRYINFVGTSNILLDLYPWTSQPVLSASIITESAYLSDKEVTWMKSRPLDYLITQIQQSKIDGSGYFTVDLFNPVKEIFAMSNTFTEFELYLNGNLKHQSGPHYMSNISVLQYHSRMPTQFKSLLHPLSFCISPESDDPTGHVNMSRVKEKVFRLTSDQTTVYATSYNILRVRDGIGGLIFNARFT